jgi:hypothetical protein
VIALALALLIAGSAPEWPVAQPPTVSGIPVSPYWGVTGIDQWGGVDDAGALDPDGSGAVSTDPAGDEPDAEDHDDEILEI